MNSLKTTKGEIPFPAYIPVTTYGSKYPLDRLIQPYLPRLAPAVMVSHYYAQEMTIKPRIPLMIDSGGFALLFEGNHIQEQNGLGCLVINKEDETELLTPWDVLDFQEKYADVAFTLDFPIPPKIEIKEARLRQKMTIANAIWALENRRKKKMFLFAVIQGWDLESISHCAKQYSDKGFDGVALGGMVPRARNREFVLDCVKTVREVLPDLPLHVFGIGNPDFLPDLYKAGVESVDSSSYVKAAADGMNWRLGSKIDCKLNTDRLFCAIQNMSPPPSCAILNKGVIAKHCKINAQGAQR